MDGKKATYTRKSTQGRKPSEVEFRKVKISARISPQSEARMKANAKKLGISSSAYIDIVLDLFEIEDYVGQQLVKT